MTARHGESPGLADNPAYGEQTGAWIAAVQRNHENTAAELVAEQGGKAPAPGHARRRGGRSWFRRLLPGPAATLSLPQRPAAPLDEPTMGYVEVGHLEHGAMHDGPPAGYSAPFGPWDTQAAREEAAAIFGQDAHGIATPATLAAIQAEAEGHALERAWAEAAALERYEAVRRVPRTQADVKPPEFRLAPARLPVDTALASLRKVTYPPAVGTPEDYAAVMQVGTAITGMNSPMERPAEWRRLAIEATGTSDEEIAAWQRHWHAEATRDLFRSLRRLSAALREVAGTGASA